MVYLTRIGIICFAIGAWLITYLLFIALPIAFGLPADRVQDMAKVSLFDCSIIGIMALAILMPVTMPMLTKSKIFIPGLALWRAIVVVGGLIGFDYVIEFNNSNTFAICLGLGMFAFILTICCNKSMGQAPQS